MTDKRLTEQPTEKTWQGYEVPIPKRKEFLGNLEKIAPKPARKAEPDDGETAGDSASRSAEQ